VSEEVAQIKQELEALACRLIRLGIPLEDVEESLTEARYMAENERDAVRAGLVKLERGSPEPVDPARL
jgi:hypothetical protein